MTADADVGCRCAPVLHERSRRPARRLRRHRPPLDRRRRPAGRCATTAGRTSSSTASSSPPSPRSTPPARASDPSGVGRSARNRFVGLVTSRGRRRRHGPGRAAVRPPPRRLPHELARPPRELGLEPGGGAVAVVKATTVIVETPGGTAREAPGSPAPPWSSRQRPPCSPGAARGTAAARGDDVDGELPGLDVGLRAPSLSRDPHRLRRRVAARRTFTEIGTAVRGRDHPGTTVTFSFAGLLRPRHAAPERRPGRRLRLRGRGEHGEGRRRRAHRGGTRRLRHQRPRRSSPPPGNPTRVASFADLADRAPNVVVCAPQVPCGAAARRSSRPPASTLTPVSEESSVTDVLGKVEAGRGRRRARLRHRRRGRRRRGDRGDLPRGRRRGEHLPDRGAGRRRARPSWRRRSRSYVTGPQGAGGAVGGRVRGPLTRGGRAGARAVRARAPACPRWALVPAALGAACSCCSRCSRWSLEVDWARVPVAGHLRVVAGGAAPVAGDGDRRRRRCCLVLGVPLALVLARARLPAAAGAALPGARCRWCCRRWWAASRCSTPSGAQGLLGRAAGGAGDRGSPSRRRRWSSRRPSCRCRSSCSSLEGALRTAGTPVRGGRRDPRRAAHHGCCCRVTLPLVLPGLVSGAVLAFARVAGGVRRHPHLRRQPAGGHAHPAAGGLPAARDRPRRRRRAVAGARRGRRRGRRRRCAAASRGLAR